MINLTAHYDKLYRESTSTIIQEGFRVDDLIDAPDDDRYGITLLLRPPAPVKRKIQEFLQQLRTIEPDQYYYPEGDIHITVMSIISCYKGFNLDQISVPDYLKILNDCLTPFSEFTIDFSGITLSPSAVLIQGFPKQPILNEIRNQLRVAFRKSTLQQSLDQRYAIQTAHATVVRFRRPVDRKKAFLEVLAQFRDFQFGSFKTDSLELVANDWYQKKSRTRLLGTFQLKP